MNLGDDANRLAAEARARVLSDRRLADAGWSVQDSRSLNLFAAQGVGRCKAAMATGHSLPPQLTAAWLLLGGQLVGRLDADDLLLRLAAPLEEAQPWQRRYAHLDPGLTRSQQQPTNTP